MALPEPGRLQPVIEADEQSTPEKQKQQPRLARPSTGSTTTPTGDTNFEVEDNVTSIEPQSDLSEEVLEEMDRRMSEEICNETTELDTLSPIIMASPVSAMTTSKCERTLEMHR